MKKIKGSNGGDPLGSLGFGDYISGGKFLEGQYPCGVKYFVLADRGEYIEALNPNNQRRVRVLPGTREGEIVETKVSGKSMQLALKPQRTVREVEKRNFDPELFPPDARRNILKAQFIKDEMHYEDDHLIVGYETPIGYTVRGGRQTEVFLAHPHAKDPDKFLMDHPDRRGDVKKAVQVIEQMQYQHPKYEFIEHDSFSQEFDIMFQVAGDGRTQAIKYDTEFTEIKKK